MGASTITHSMGQVEWWGLLGMVGENRLVGWLKAWRWTRLGVDGNFGITLEGHPNCSKTCIIF